ncbi:hypothetical protein ES703_105878 [subsurface metagenome]
MNSKIAQHMLESLPKFMLVTKLNKGLSPHNKICDEINDKQTSSYKNN